MRTAGAATLGRTHFAVQRLQMPHTLTANTAASDAASEAASRRNFWRLTLGCIGVVYGDIGTSPLYALRESVLAAAGGGRAAADAVIPGILSLIVWVLLLIVTVKYVLILLRADNDGEGGTLALMALANRALGGNSSAIIMPGARRFMPISVISAKAQFRQLGSSWPCQRSRSIISAKAHCCWQSRKRSRIRFTCCSRAGRCCP
jgi:hypothetical protein